MAETLQFDLVSPERSLASMQAWAVKIPGTEGDLTAMPDHMPLITTLRPGILTVRTDEGDQEFVITGGFAEVGDGLTVLAEHALPRADMTQEKYEAMVKQAEDLYGQAQDNFMSEPGAVDEAAKMLSDIVALGNQIGLSSSS